MCDVPLSIYKWCTIKYGLVIIGALDPCIHRAKCHMGTIKAFSEFPFAATHILLFCLFNWVSMAKEEPREQFHLHSNIFPDKCTVSGSKGAEVTKTLPRHSGARLEWSYFVFRMSEWLTYQTLVKARLPRAWPELQKHSLCPRRSITLGANTRTVHQRSYSLGCIGSPPSAIM